MIKKDKMAGGTVLKGFACPITPSFSGADFACRERVILGLSRFETNTKLLRGVIKPISTSNAEAAETMPSHGPHGKSFDLLQFSPCV